MCGLSPVNRTRHYRSAVRQDEKQSRARMRNLFSCRPQPPRILFLAFLTKRTIGKVSVNSTMIDLKHRDDLSQSSNSPARSCTALRISVIMHITARTSQSTVWSDGRRCSFTVPCSRPNAPTRCRQQVRLTYTANSSARSRHASVIQQRRSRRARATVMRRTAHVDACVSTTLNRYNASAIPPPKTWKCSLAPVSYGTSNAMTCTFCRRRSRMPCNACSSRMASCPLVS